MSCFVRFGACILLPLSFGCGEVPLEPSAITGIWALETVEGQPVPALAVDQPFESVLFISDTLDLATDGTFGGRRCELHVNHESQLESTVCIPYSGSYTLRVRTLELWYACPLSTNCYGATSRTGTIRDERLVLSARSDAPDLGYARVE